MKIEIPKPMADKFTAKLELIEELQTLEARRAEFEKAIKENSAELDRVNARIDEISKDQSDFDRDDIILVAEAIRNRHNAPEDDPDTTKSKKR